MTVEESPPGLLRTTARNERSPTVENAVLMTGFFLFQYPLTLLGLAPLFALSPVVGLTPWTLVTSVYAHAGPGHLLSNLAVLLVVGLLVERVTTRARYYAFFLTTGAVAGLTEVFLPVVGAPAVLGASGAVFGLLGYLITGNVVADTVFGLANRTFGSAWAAPALSLAVGLMLAVLLSGPNSAFVAHLTGLCLGMASGSFRLLHVDTSTDRPRESTTPQ